MFILERTRRSTRAAAERIREALIELDELFQTYHVFHQQIDEEASAPSVYQVIADHGTYVVALDDPSM